MSTPSDRLLAALEAAAWRPGRLSETVPVAVAETYAGDAGLQAGLGSRTALGLVVAVRCAEPGMEFAAACGAAGELVSSTLVTELTGWASVVAALVGQLAELSEKPPAEVVRGLARDASEVGK